MQFPIKNLRVNQAQARRFMFFFASSTRFLDVLGQPDYHGDLPVPLFLHITLNHLVNLVNGFPQAAAVSVRFILFSLAAP
jgi:hypothetical protein